VVERGPEKAGVGGSIPSLATIKILASGNNHFSFEHGLRGLSILPETTGYALTGSRGRGRSKHERRHFQKKLTM
jgi:hypothetical protein